jgi:cation diffusion facilitator CzcD-associated flavoprotein CzcO
VPSRFYSYSFEPNPDWTRQFSPGAEIWRYFERVATTYGLRPHIQLNKEVVSGRFEDGGWRIRTADGDETFADFLVSACGVLHHPRYPQIEGVDRFAGAAFHSARWDHGVELRGKRIAVVGTGSTGVQLVSHLADVAGRLYMFQRTAQWVFPVPDRPYSRVSRWVLRRFPALGRLAYRVYQAAFELIFGRAVIEDGWQRSVISWMSRCNLARVKDPVLRAKLTPDYQPMCKRLVMSWRFYRAVQQPNVELVTDPIDHAEPAGVVTRDGRLREIDVLVFATGFDFHAFMRPMQLVGTDGITLEEAWRGEPTAYRTVALPGFPNFFMIMGPHSPVGNQSLIAVAETQADYIMQWIRLFAQGRVAAIAPTEEATERFNTQMRAALPDTVWSTGCRSWYLGKDGLPALWPWTPERHREMLRAPALEEFAVDVAARQEEH